MEKSSVFFNFFIFFRLYFKKNTCENMKIEKKFHFLYAVWKNY